MTFYADQKEVARRLGLTETQFLTLASAHARSDAFKKDPVTKLFIWPKIQAYLLTQSGVISNGVTKPDGLENWNNGKQSSW